MNKQDFLWQLERNLVMGAEEKSEVMRYYIEYFEEAGPENEQAVLEELGDPRALAEKLNAECKTEETQAEEPWTEAPAWQEAIDEAEMALREAERTTRSVFTSLKDIFGGVRTEKELHEFCDHDMEPFHSIRVDVENCPITVVPSEDDNYGVEAKFFVGDQGKWEVRVNDGILTVKKQYSSKRVWIEFGFSGHSGKNSEYVRIYLPKVAMEIIELDTSNASIQVEDVSVQTLIADTSNAMIRIEDTKVLDELKADTSNGAISLSRVQGEDITLDTSNGAINLENVIGRVLNADTSNGAIRAKGCEFEEELHADTSNGSIEALLVGSEHEYSIHADTSNAKIHVDGQVKGDEYNSNGGSKGVWLDTSNGRITIGFVSRS